MKLIANAFNLADTMELVDNAYRINTSKNNRPAKIVVAFRNESTRARWLERKKNCRLTSHDIFKDNSTERIWVGENMTASLRKLFWECRVKTKQVGYQFCWFRNGKIFVRATEAREL